jgi:hypothetical protein
MVSRPEAPRGFEHVVLGETRTPQSPAQHTAVLDHDGRNAVQNFSDARHVDFDQ